MLEAAREHERFVMESGSVPALTKALCGAMVAALNYCTPALVAQRRRARELGASAQMLTEIWDYARSTHYDGAQRAALAAAVALTREPRALPEAVRGELQAHFDDAQIVEILCAIGASNYLNRVQNALGT